MTDKEVHDFLFKLYDYTDYLADKIQSGDPDSNIYFMLLVDIEYFFDSTGRGDISSAARRAAEYGLDPNKSLAEAHRRIDRLRDRINDLARAYDFDDTLDNRAKHLMSYWPKSHMVPPAR